MLQELEKFYRRIWTISIFNFAPGLSLESIGIAFKLTTAAFLHEETIKLFKPTESEYLILK